jgi:hypothetical protein
MRGTEYQVLDVARRGGRILLRLHIDGEVRWSAVVTVPGSADGAGVVDLLGTQVVADLMSALVQHGAPTLAVRVADDDLATVGWHELVPGQVVIDYSYHVADELLRPVGLPIGILLADLGQRFPFDEHRARPMHHFATTALGTIGAERLEDTLRRLPHDVVHVRASVTEVGGDVWLGTPSSGIPARRLRSLLRSRAKMTRLVVLEVDRADIRPAFLLARRLRRGAGPTVLVTDAATDFHEFYLGIAHSEDLGYITSYTHPTVLDPRLPRLVMSDGGTAVLDLRAVEQRFRARAEAQRRRVAELTARADTTQLQVPDYDAVWSPTIDNLQLGYNAESEGMEPMSDVLMDLRNAEVALRRLERATARVVNAWFAYPEGTVLPSTFSLQTDTRYHICVSVGPVAAQSNITTPLAVDERVLARHADDSGVAEVRVVLISDDLEIADEVQTLRVPRPPAASRTVEFLIVTSSEPGRVTARLSLYAAQNLLQSVALSAEVTTTLAPPRAGANSGRVDWVMTGRLDEADQFGDKAFSILTNDNGSGSHLVAVESEGFRSHVTLLEGQVTELLRQGRVALQWAAGDPEQGEHYRYAPDNNGTAEQLRTYLTGLAEFGWTMFTTLITSQSDDSFEQGLAAALASPTTIQFARTASSRLMYPWALVYDQPLEPNPGNKLCSTFLDTVRTGRSIEDSVCFTQGCAHRADTNVVCPSGFWGYRHVVEQPLGAFDPGDLDVLLGHNNVPAEIAVNGAIDTFVGYSAELDPSAQHADAILGLAGVYGSRGSARREVSTGLQTQLKLVYFFCHGGSSAGKAWLGVGGTPMEKISPPDLRVWNVTWPTSRPLVFINGCDTVAARPSDLATFNEGFRYCKASGVIGTEIEIPVELGREFGATLLGCITRDRLPVGDAVRKVRLELLSRYNAMGLAYTPYCLARLRMTG